MKRFAHRIAIAAALVLGLAARPAAARGASTSAAPALSPASALGGNGYPTFCAIPASPSDARTPAGFKAAVVDLRQSGVILRRRTGPASWSLADAEGFAAEARTAATPPPRIVDASQSDTEAFAAAARAAAKPPAHH